LFYDEIAHFWRRLWKWWFFF